MLILYYHPLCSFSRQIKFLLIEKKIDFEIKKENFWEKNLSLLSLNPAVELPILITEDGNICGIWPIYEYLEEKYPEEKFIGNSLSEKAETRRLFDWFNRKTYQEVVKYIISERLIKRFQPNSCPKSDFIRAAKHNLFVHLDYIDFLLSRRKWLAGEKFSSADLAASCQISVLDYFGDIDWDYNHNVKSWYSVIKSKPSFQALLKDRVPGIEPSAYYNLLDF